MFGNTTKIIEALATIKADTKNHKEDLQEFKVAFGKHIEKEETQSVNFNKKIDDVHCTIKNFECPHEQKIQDVERRVHDYNKTNQKRRVLDLETKSVEAKERAIKDEEIAKEISSLKTTRKYTYLSMSGLYVILGVILKKIFAST